MFGKPHITVLGVNNATGFVQILTHGSKYTCVTKEENGELLFRFKDKWYQVDQFTNEYTHYFG